MMPLRIVLAAASLALSCLAAAAQAPGMPMTAGHFRLTTPDDATIDSDELAGRPYGLFFGFTRCPDICPTTLAELSMALERLPGSAGDLRVYFVTVDPERDSAETLKLYTDSFDPRIVGLRGDRVATDEALASFGAVARRTELPGGGYTYAHTASVILVDRDGLIAGRIGADAGTDALAGSLAELARGFRPASRSPPSRAAAR